MSHPNANEYAKFSERLGATIIDLAICFFLMLVFVFIAVRPIFMAVMIPGGVREHADATAIWMAAEPSQKAIVLFLFAISAWLPSCLYYALFESGKRRATFGKRALDLMTVRLDGSCVSFPRAAARHLFRSAVSSIVPLGFIAMLPVFGQRSQGAHDWLTGIVVVKRGEVLVKSISAAERDTRLKELKSEDKGRVAGQK